MSSALREALFVAAREDDFQAMYELCSGNADAIRKNFEGWRQVPEAVRANEDELQDYVEGLFKIAEFFANELGDESLREILAGAAGRDTLEGVEAALDDARSFLEEAQYDEAINRAREAMQLLSGLEGPGVQYYMAVIHGTIGDAHFHGGVAERAVEPLTKALTLCDASRDMNGVASYLGSLHEVHRYLGNREESAGFAERLADLLDQSGNAAAAHFRKKAAQVRAGEPLNRVIIQTETQTYELDEIVDQPPSGRFRFVFERNRIAVGGCVHHLSLGRAHAAKGDYSEALEEFRAASRIDPFDPDPHYNRALCLLDSGQFDEAVKAYETTEALAPGWFHCRGDLWIAQKLASGEMTHDTYWVIRDLEDGSEEPAGKVARARAALEDAPDCAPLWLLLGKSLFAMDERDEAVAAYRRGLQCVEDDAHRTRLLTAIGAVSSDLDVRREVLTQAVQLNGNLVAGAMARVLLLQS